MSDRKTVRAHKTTDAPEQLAVPTERPLPPLTPVKKGPADPSGALFFNLSPLPMPPKYPMALPEHTFANPTEMVIINTPMRVPQQQVVPGEEDLPSAISRVIFESSGEEDRLSSFVSESQDEDDSEASEVIEEHSHENSSESESEVRENCA